MSYRDSFTPREYQIMLDIEHNGKKLSEIAKAQGVSTTRIRVLYRQANMRRKQFYLAAIQKANGSSDQEITGLRDQLGEEYYKDIYVNAYLEKEYGEILATLRDGEPGVPKEIIQELPPLRGALIPNYRYKLQEPPRTVLHQDEIYVLQERDKNKSYAEIGKSLGVTDAKARRLHDMALHTLMHKDINTVAEETGRSHRDITAILFSYSEDSRKWQKYLWQEYGDILAKEASEE